VFATNWAQIQTTQKAVKSKEIKKNTNNTNNKENKQWRECEIEREREDITKKQKKENCGVRNQVF